MDPLDPDLGPGLDAGAVAAYAHRTAIGRLLSLADLPFADVEGGEGWVAVRTGIDGHDLNGVVSNGATGVDAGTVADLTRWFGDLPASWLTPDPDPVLTALLRDRGWTTDDGARRAGRRLDGGLPSGEGAIPMGDPTDHLDVVVACGGHADAERSTRRALLAPHPLRTHVVVRRDGRPVGVATGFLGAALEVVEVAVLPDHQRQGVGTALVGALCAWGAERGLDVVVATPTSDGAGLLEALGFGLAPVVAETTFRAP